jgi:hypothetical protein
MQWPRDRRINHGVAQPVSKKRIGKYASTTINFLWKRGFLLGPCKGVIRKTIWATQSVESRALQGRLRRDDRWQFSCGVLTSGQRCDQRSWRISIVEIRSQETTTESRLRSLSVCSALVTVNSPIHTPSTVAPLNRDNIVTCQPSIGLRSRALLGSRQLNASRANTRSAAVGEAMFAPYRAVPSRTAPSAATQQARWRHTSGVRERHMCLRGCQETSRHLVRLQGEWETWRNSTVEQRNDRC